MDSVWPRENPGPEQQLLLWTLNSILAGKAGDAARLPDLSLFEEDNWTAFSRLVLFEGLAGIIPASFYFLPEDFPDELAEAFTVFLERQRESNEKRTAEFVSVLKTLHEAGIRTMPFKGPFLAERIYHDIGARSFWDFDFLFPYAQIENLNRVLVNHGFSSNLPATPRQQRAYWSYAGQGVYRSGKDGLALEPHWAFAPANIAIDLDYEKIWSRSRTDSWRGVDISLLSPEDEFLMLAIHGSKEAWGKAKYIFDFASFLKANQNLDWEYIECVSRDRDLGRLINLGLTMVTRTFPGCSDWKFSLQVKDKVVDRLIARIQSSPFSIAPEIYYFNPYFMAIRKRPENKLKYLLRTLVTPRNSHFNLLAIPDVLFFLYTPFKILYDGAILPSWKLWKAVTGSSSDQPSA